MPEPTVIPNPVWGAQLTAAVCEGCDWRYLLPPGRLPMQCPHCAAAQLTALEDAPADDLAHGPELYLPFTVEPQTVAQRIKKFAGGIWFAPSDLKPETLQQRMQRLYLPVWLVDSHVEATWQAEAGFNYEALSHRESYEDGQWVSQQITETRVRWEPRLGRLTRTYHNIPAPALEEHFDLMTALGQYDFEAGQPYRAQAIADAVIRLPNRSTRDAWPEAAPVFQGEAAADCHRATAADDLREFRWQASYRQQHWTLLLLPLYASYYLDDDRRPHSVLINGWSGQMSGSRKASMRRAQQAALFMVVAAAITFTISLVVGLVSLLVPPLLLFAGLGVLLAVFLGALAVAPIAIVWQFNRTQQQKTQKD